MTREPHHCAEHTNCTGHTHGSEHPHCVGHTHGIGHTHSTEDALVADIIAEFSQVFAFARTRWARYAEEVHPELRGVGMMILQTIMRRESITATELSHLLDMDKSVVSRQIARLRELGLIVAEPSPEDRRVVLLSGSPAAEETIEKLKSQTAHAYHERFEGWDADELHTLQSLLHRFNLSTPSHPQLAEHR